MAAHVSAVPDLVLHGPRVLGFASAARVAARYGLDAPEADSCHTVWIQLHEDLLATLGVPRGGDA